MGHFLQKAPHSIVILRALQLGDLLCAVPAIRALRTAYPNARISLVGLPWAADFVKRFSHYLDEFIEFPGWPGLPERKPDLERIPVFLESMRSRRFDLALQMQGAGTITNPLVALFGARQMAGFYLPSQYQPNTKGFLVYPEGEHEIRIFLRLMEALGIPSQGEHLEFPVTAEERQAFDQFRQAHRLKKNRYVCLHPGARFEGRRWSPEKFAAVGDALAEQGYQVVVTGSAAESELTGAVAGAMQSPALDAAGQTDLGTLALLLANARLLISNDTGVSHMAAALSTPSVVLFTVSPPQQWRPLNQHLHRIRVGADKTSAEEVLAEAYLLLRETHNDARQPI